MSRLRRPCFVRHTLRAGRDARQAESVAGSSCKYFFSCTEVLVSDTGFPAQNKSTNAVMHCHISTMCNPYPNTCLKTCVIIVMSMIQSKKICPKIRPNFWPKSSKSASMTAWYVTCYRISQSTKSVCFRLFVDWENPSWRGKGGWWKSSFWYSAQPVRPRGPGTMLRPSFCSHVHLFSLSGHSGLLLVPFNIIKAKRVDGPESRENGGFA